MRFEHMKLKYIVLILTTLFFVQTSHAIPTKKSADSLYFSTLNRVLVTLTHAKNIVSFEGSLGIKTVKIISANPLEGLDFREYPSLIIRIEIDGREEVNEKIMDFVEGKNKKKKIAMFDDEKFQIENFQSLKIIIEDPTFDLKHFKIDLWIFLH